MRQFIGGYMTGSLLFVILLGFEVVVTVDDERFYQLEKDLIRLVKNILSEGSEYYIYMILKGDEKLQEFIVEWEVSISEVIVYERV